MERPRRRRSATSGIELSTWYLVMAQQLPSQSATQCGRLNVRLALSIWMSERCSREARNVLVRGRIGTTGGSLTQAISSHAASMELQVGISPRTWRRVAVARAWNRCPITGRWYSRRLRATALQSFNIQLFSSPIMTSMFPPSHPRSDLV